MCLSVLPVSLMQSLEFSIYVYDHVTCKQGQFNLFLSDFDVVVFQSLSHVQLSVTPWTVAYQIPLSVGFPRQEY